MGDAAQGRLAPAVRPPVPLPGARYICGMTELTPELLLRAYALGIFPMSDSRSSRDLYWLDPEWRGIILPERLHVPRRLRRTLRRHDFEIRIDSAFPEVIARC